MNWQPRQPDADPSEASADQRQVYTSKVAREEELPGEVPGCPAGCW